MASIEDLHKEIGDIDQFERQIKICKKLGLKIRGPVYEPYRPQGEAKEILDAIIEFAEKEKPVTIRQTFYYLVTLGKIPNTEKAYDNLDKILTRARKAGIIPFEWFIDRSRHPVQVRTYSNIQEFLKQKIQYYYKDTWENQSVYIMVWIEKEALVGVISPVTTYYNVPLFVGKGYSSWSTFLKAVEVYQEHPDKTLVFLYLGDYDPSGIDIFRDLQARFEKLGVQVYFERLALTREQIEEYNLPPMPVKERDPRSGKFLEEHADFAVELDALPPSILRQIVEEGIMKYLDLEAFERDQQLEREEKVELQRIVEAIARSARD